MLLLACFLFSVFMKICASSVPLFAGMLSCLALPCSCSLSAPLSSLVNGDCGSCLSISNDSDATGRQNYLLRIDFRIRIFCVYGKYFYLLRYN